LSSSWVEVIQMPWWEAVLFFVAVIVAIWGFLIMVGVETRFWTRGHGRTAQDMYDQFADSSRKQRRYARRHGGEWRNE
jgi:hypothetical protein